MKKMAIALLMAAVSSGAMAQEVTSYAADSTAYYNSLYNPNDYAQAPIKGPQRRVGDSDGRSRIHTSINMGTGFGSMGNYQFLSPSVSYDATKRLSLQFGMGLQYSNFKIADMAGERLEYRRASAVTNYYSVSAAYQASDRCVLYGGLVYGTDVMQKGEPRRMDSDRYTAIMGATFNITKSLSIGVEVRQQKNMSPFGGYGYPCGYGW